MIVCHCNGVRDRQVRAAVQRGATSRKAVARACGAGSACGGCRPAVEEIIAEELARCPHAHQMCRATELMCASAEAAS